VEFRNRLIARRTTGGVWIAREMLPALSDVTFESLGITKVLCEAVSKLNWKSPTVIQQQAIPVALSGKDVIGLAATGSGKTGA
jgi:superfamily II DNA/RNA helicase